MSIAIFRFVAVGSFSNIFAIVNLDTGKELTKLVLPNAVESSCLVSSGENYVYIGCFDSKLYCVEVDTANIIWEYVTDDRIKNKPIFLNKDAILFGSYDKNIYCISPKVTIHKSTLKTMYSNNLDLCDFRPV